MQFVSSSFSFDAVEYTASKLFFLVSTAEALSPSPIEFESIFQGLQIN